MDEKTLRDTMRYLGQRRWAEKTAEERSAHAKLMVTARERLRKKRTSKKKA